MALDESEKIVKNSYILMIGYVLSSLISTIGTIVVIRTISVEENSLINIAYILPGIIIPIGELGLNYASTHFIARSMKENQFRNIKDIIKINLLIKTVVGFFLTIIVASSAAYISKVIYNVDDDRMILLVQISSIGVISSIFYDSLNSIFLGAENMKIVRIGSIMRTSLRTLISIVLILMGFTLIGPLLGFVLSTVIVVIYYIPCLKVIFPKNKTNENLKSLKKPIDWKILLKMIKYGYPLLIYSILLGLEAQIFILILTNLGYITEVAYFNVAVISAALIGILTKSIRLTIFPVFSENDWDENEKNKKILMNRFHFSIKFSTIIVVSSSIFLIYFSQVLFPLVFGEAYLDADYFIKVSLLVYILIPLGSLSVREFLNSQKQTIYFLIWEFIFLISSVFIGLILIYYIGAIGIVWGLFCGELISAIYGDIIMQRKYGNFIIKNLKKNTVIMLIAAFSGAITFLIYYYLTLFYSFSNFIIVLSVLAFLSIIYFGLFLFFIGIFSLITEEEINFIIEGFNFISIINKAFRLIAKIEKKILKIRTKL